MYIHGESRSEGHSIECSEAGCTLLLFKIHGLRRRTADCWISDNAFDRHVGRNRTMMGVGSID